MYDEILTIYNDTKNLGFTLSLLNWDQSTYMPAGGVNSRADITETISKISHDMIISDRYYDKIMNFIGSAAFKDLDEFKKAEILKIKEDTEKQRKIPTSLVQETAKTAALAMNAWDEAKKTDDDKSFLPLLEKIFSLKIEYAEAAGYEDNPYDALLDDYDRGLKYKYIKPLFEQLEKELVVITDKIFNSGINIKDDFLNKNYDEKKQWDFGLSILKKMGIDSQCFRLDKSAHPFTAGVGGQDVRITTNIKENSFTKGFFSTIHEGGHCLYELSADKHFTNSPFGIIDSLSLHESQSRFFENLMARSYDFWVSNYKELQNVFYDNLKNITVEEFYKAINKVEKSLIRIESDEATYNLHIIIRTELENDLINKKITVRSVNEAWNEKTKKFFNRYPGKKSEGYLQDIHWSDGLIGYFPTYTIGNLISSQLFNLLKSGNGKVNEFNDENLMKTVKWLDGTMYKYGSRFKSMDLVKKITGEDLKYNYFIDYLKSKFYNIYS